VDVQWDIRTLKEFGDYPIEKLIGQYDLIVIDHPYTGSAAANKLLLPLDDHLPRGRGGNATISNQYRPSTFIASTNPERVTGFVMNEFTPRR